MASSTKNIPSWFQSYDTDIDTSSDEENKQESQSDEMIQTEKVEIKPQTTVDNELEMKADNEDKYITDDDSDSTNRGLQRMMPPNLNTSFRSRGNKIQSLFGTGRGLRRLESTATDTSIITDRPSPETQEGGSVASYMKGFSGNTVGSISSTSSLRLRLMKMMSIGSILRNKGMNEETNQTKSTVTGRPPRSRPPLPTGRKMNEINHNVPLKSPQSHRPSIGESLKSPVTDATPTLKSISTMDTEDCTLEGGVPSVIYCFMKNNPFDDDLGFEDSWSSNRFHLRKVIMKHLSKTKPKTHIDEDDIENYEQTLVDI